MSSHICFTYNQAELQSTHWQCIYLTNWKSSVKTRAGQVWRSEDICEQTEGCRKEQEDDLIFRMHELQRMEKPVGPSQIEKD